jgi:hypothetical protein
MSAVYYSAHTAPGFAPQHLPEQGWINVPQDVLRKTQAFQDPRIRLSELFNKMNRPDPSQLGTIMMTGNKSLESLQKTIIRLQNGRPETLQRMHLLFGHNMNGPGCIAGLRLIMHRLERHMERKTFLIDPNTKPGVLAYVFSTPSVTYPSFSPFMMLAARFFQLPLPARANVLVHESSHQALAIRDQALSTGETAYGLLNAIALAGENENLAVRNADNWASFVEGAVPQFL